LSSKEDHVSRVDLRRVRSCGLVADFEEIEHSKVKRHTAPDS
jgi:hypothetical protein